MRRINGLSRVFISGMICLVTTNAAAQIGFDSNGGAITNVAPAVNPDDAVIKQQLDDESAARIAGDQGERTDRISADNALSNLLSKETEARVAGDAALADTIAQYAVDGQQINGRFDAEATARTAAIAAEAESRATADAAEASVRIANDQALDAYIRSESAVRLAGDTQLNLRIDGEAGARMAADAAEASARLAADTALGGRIDNETRERMIADHAIRQEIASSTAIAIALGGAVILPDLDFTLSGNIATYKGAQAIALNGSARVGPNTYVTSALGGGMNKRGSVGARVGFVVGF